MKKKCFTGWLPAVLVLACVVLVVCFLHTLPEDMPCHFNPQGVASGTMPRNTLLWYPLVATVLGLLPYIFIRKQRPLTLHLSSASLVAIVLCSLGVSLTQGKCPALMFSEPVFLVLAIVFFILAWKKARKHAKKG